MAHGTEDIDAILRKIEEAGGVIIREFRSRDELASEMQAAIDGGRKCAFLPTLKTLREFLNTQGFVLVMSEVNSQLRKCRILVEPNCYGSKHVFVVAHLNEQSEYCASRRATHQRQNPEAYASAIIASGGMAECCLVLVGPTISCAISGPIDH